MTIAGGLAALTSSAWASSAWAQSTSTAIPIVIGKSGHIFTPVTVRGKDFHALFNNSQPTAFDIDAPIFRSTTITSLPEGVIYGKLPALIVTRIGGAHVKTQLAMRGLRTFSRVNGLDVHMVIGSDTFEEYVVEFDFRRKLAWLHQRDRFVAPANATLLPKTGAKPKRLLASVSLGDEVSGMAEVTLDYAGLISVSHPKVSAWLNDGRKVSEQDITTVLGDLVLKTDQVAFTSPPLKVGPFILGEVQATADPEQYEDIIATLGVMALRPFHVWIDMAGGQMWLRPNTA